MSARGSHIGQTLILLLAADIIGNTFAAAQQSSQSVASSDVPFTPTMTFDVVSIRESKPDFNTGFTMSGNFAPNSTSMKLTNFDLRHLLNMAYGSGAYGDQFDEVSGIPLEFDRAMFSIQAKSGSDADEKLAKLPKEQARAERHHMVETLLADRFNLKVHFETRHGPNYDLILSKKGRLQEAAGAPRTPEDLKMFGDKPIPSLYQTGSYSTGYHFIAHACTMQYLATVLADELGRPTVNKTGLTAKYDFDLLYRDLHMSDRRDDDTNPTPPLDTAIQDQLGLKLEPSTGPVRVLVIDHIEKPSEN